MNFELLREKFNIDLIQCENAFPKIRVSANDIYPLLHFMKNTAENSFDRLTTIIAVDLESNIELIYDLYCTDLRKDARVSVLLDRNFPSVDSVVEIYKSAYFDECEIYDLFGVNFKNNPDLKRLFMPKGWIGHPLRKDYKENDERLVWNK